MAVLLVCDRCGEVEPTGVLYTLEAHSISGRAMLALVDREEVQLCERCVAEAVKAIEVWLQPKGKA